MDTNDLSYHALVQAVHAELDETVKSSDRETVQHVLEYLAARRPGRRERQEKSESR